MRKPQWGQGVMLLLSISAAYAQAPANGAAPGAPPPQLTRGTVQSITDSTLTVKAADGSATTYALPAGAVIAKFNTKTVADLKPGEFVGSTSVAGNDGKRRATEVHIISERGLGEGHRPMDAEHTMTNGNVDAATAAGKNKTLTISYKGGAQVIDVAPDTPVTSMDSATRADLTPGTAVTVMAGKDASGNPVANRVMIGSMTGR